MSSGIPIETRIEQAFERYQVTLELTERLYSSQANPVEIVLLACSRIDALSNLSATGGPARERFVQFVTTYGARRPELVKVSVADLYSYLAREYWLLPGTLNTAGSLTEFGSDSSPFLRFLADSGLPLTEDAIRRFLERWSGGVQRRYRTTATQSKAKPSFAGLRGLVDHVDSEIKHSRWKAYAPTLIPAFRTLASGFSIASLLYREIRSGAIHEHAFGLDDTHFFTKPVPYVDTIKHAFDDVLYLGVYIPGRWLLDLFESCVQNYKASLLNTRKLPIDLFSEICVVPDELDYLDEGSIPKERVFRPRILR
jgi:hypothetical protein